MKKLLVLFLFSVFSTLSLFSDVWVNGYHRSDGTYVPGHWRSSPNGTDRDNWSVKGNRNPYTGKAGTKNPKDYYPRIGSYR